MQIPKPAVALTPLVFDQSPRLSVGVFLKTPGDLQLAPFWVGLPAAVVLKPLASSKVGSVNPLPSPSATELTATVPFWT